MKAWLLTLMVLSSCSTLKNKEFEKQLNKPIQQAKVEASPEDEKILDKFEVHTVKPSDKSQPKNTEVVVTKKPTPLPKEKVTTKSKTETSKVIEKKLPSDYPPELISINEKAKKVWSKYKSNHPIGEKVYLDIHYLGMTVGKILVTNKGKKVINDKEVWHFHARFKSAPFYSNIYELDDTVDTFVSTDEFLSVRYSLIQRESKVSIDDLQLFDRDQLKTFWFYKQKKTSGKVKNKKAETPLPYFSVDPFSVLYLYQGLPLENNDVYEIPIVNKGKILILTSKVEGREVIKTEYGDKKSIRVQASTKYSGDTLKSGDLTFWFSDDERRVLLKAKAKIQIGSVTAEIVKD